MFSNSTQLSKELLENVLSRLGFSSQPELNHAGLSALYEAWCSNVPFDNMRKLIHLHENNPQTLPGDDATDFFESWLKHKSGGTCWAANGALFAFLNALGFSVGRGVATMLVAPDIPPNHGTVIVDFDGEQFLVDASILHKVPIALKKDSADYPPWIENVSQSQSQWQVLWRPLRGEQHINCRIDRFPVEQQEFHERHEQTRLWSPFNFQLNLQSMKQNTIVGFADGQWAKIDANGAVQRSPLSPEERKRFLVDEIGISEELVDKLPPDRPTPPPPWSKTAQGL